MISVFITVGPYANDRRRLNRENFKKNAAVWCDIPGQKMLEFYS